MMAGGGRGGFLELRPPGSGDATGCVGDGVAMVMDVATSYEAPAAAVNQSATRSINNSIHQLISMR